MSSPDRDYSFDTLRGLAVLFVVILHITATYVVNEPAESSEFFVANVLNSFTRVAVPIFVLVSGRFLLNAKYSYQEFYQKRLNRIGVPFLFWSLIYSFYTLIGHKILHGELNFLLIFRNILNGVPHYHLWYLYMLIGLYTVTPFIRSVINHIGQRSSQLLGVFLIVAGILIDLWDRYHGNSPIPILWFIPFLGYFVLGGTINYSKNLPVAYVIFAFLASSSATAALTQLASFDEKNLYFYSYLSPFVIVASVSLYLIATVVSVRANILSNLSRHSLGIYLVHAGILDFYNLLVFPNGISGSAVIDICLLFVLVLSPSLLCVLLMSRVSVLRKVL